MSKLWSQACIPLAGLTLLIGIAGSVRAQGSAEDYERAREHGKRFAGLVQGAKIEPVWLDSQRVAVRRPHPDGWSFVVADGEQERVEAAFDHERLAGALKIEVGRGFEAHRLPLRIVSIDGDSVGFVVEGSDGAFQVSRRGADLKRVSIEELPGARLDPGGPRRSGGSGSESSLAFVNRSMVRAEVQWLDADGAAHAYVTLEPGERHDQPTFEGHVWLVRALDGRELGPFVAREVPAAVLVTDSAFEVGSGGSEDDAPPARESSANRDSPDGRWRVRTEGSQVRLEDRESGAQFEVALASDAEDERSRRVVWAPDSASFGLLRAIPAAKRTMYLIESAPAGSVHPILHEQPYRKPGDAIDALRVAVVDVSTRREVPIADPERLANPWALDQLRFSPDSRELWVRYNKRGHQVYGVYAVEVASGAVRAIVEDVSQTFINYSNKGWMKHLEERDELLWTSERSGWNHLYAVARSTGEVRALSSGSWVLRAVDDVDESAGTALIRGLGVYPGQDPYHVHFGRVDLLGGGVTWLTESDGSHSIDWGPGRELYVASWSRVDQAPVHELRRGVDGSLVAVLSRANAEALEAAGWMAPQRFSAMGRDGKTPIWGVIHRPTGFDPTRRYPVIESIYAGPHGHFVPKSFAVQRGVSQLVELGFVVVQIDGMGTNWRSKEFHDVCWKNLGDSGFPDRVAWLHAAAREYPWMDLERGVGIYGGSAGGQSSTRALLAHGDVYKVAVSDCGCHDNRVDKIWWNEAWMGWPVGEHYAASSNVEQAHRLKGELLLVVGELDRNVDPVSTFQVVDALIRADKDFDLLVIPGAGHGAAETSYGKRRRQDFFVEHLMGVEPRWE